MLAPQPAPAQAPQVVVTLKPVHSLIASVMRGVGAPALLLPDGASPHAYALRPSEARLLAGARLIFWIGEEMETFLIRPLATLGPGAEVVTLAREAGVTTTSDPHVWLDPAKARAIAAIAASRLTQADPAHAADYAANGQLLTAELAALDAALDARLAPVRGVKFVVYHDAYGHFTSRYALAVQGAVTLHAGHAPGARHIAELRQTMLTKDIACVFTEPQFPPALARTLVRGTAARIGELDPLGAGIPAGPEAYGRILRGLAGALVSCLAAPRR